MPHPILPSSFIARLHELRAAFTKPSFDNFLVLVCGAVHALGKHRVTDLIRAAGRAAGKHYCSYFRFFSHGRWSLDELGLLLLRVVLRLFPSAEVVLVLDDTLVRRSGKKVALGSMHADPLLSRPGRAFHSYGHVFVVLAVHVRVPGLASTGWALPFMFRLFRGPRHGGRKDSPSDRRRARARRRAGKPLRNRVRKTDQRVVDGELVECEPYEDPGPSEHEPRPTKLQLAAEMIVKVARRFPKRSFYVVADHLYNGRNVLLPVHTEVNNVSIVVRGRKDADLYELPPKRLPGTRGRPRVKGVSLPKPVTWAAENAKKFQPMTVELYGRAVRVLVASYCGMPYRSLPGRLVRYIIVKDPEGIYRTEYFFTTNIQQPAAEALRMYSFRWPIERTFQDCKDKLGLQQPQVQLPGSVRRCAPFGMLVYSLVMLWYLTDGHKLAATLRHHHDPWYAKPERPSFAEMLATLRRLSWAESLSSHDPEQDLSHGELAAYLIRVAAAA